METGKFNEPIAAHMLVAGEVADTTAKGILARPGIEVIKGQTEVTYTDNSKTVISTVAGTKVFVVSANANLFVGQCIKLGTQVVVIVSIVSTTITVDRVITAVATNAVTESAYYSVYRFDKDADKNGNWQTYTNYFNIELKGSSTDGRQDLVFPNDVNIADYYVDLNVTTKPISILLINASNVVTPIYYFKPF